MKIFNKISWLVTIALVTIAFTSCDKKDFLATHQQGHDITLTASKTTIAPTAADSMTNVVTFSWGNPEYATDTANQKFVLEIDSAGRNFATAKTRIVTGVLSTSFTGKQLNDMLADFGFAPGQTFSFDIRVSSSYGNNNELRRSNAIKVTIASYLVPVTLVASSTSPLVLQVSNASNTAVAL